MMTTRDRFKVFGVGFFVGMIIVTVFIMSRQPKDKRNPELLTPEETQLAAVPGIVEAYQERGVPMRSDFIKAERTYPIDNKYSKRVVIIGGHDADQILRIEELVRAADATYIESIEAWRIMAADRIRIQLNPKQTTQALAQAMKQWNYRILRKGEHPNEYIIGMPNIFPNTLNEGLSNLKELSQFVTAVSPDYLDMEFLDEMPDTSRLSASY